MHLITRTVLPGELVFDIGANAGDKTEWFATRGIRVVAVEPQPYLAQHLRARFEGNPFVTIIEKGVASEPGTLTMSISTNHVLSTFTETWKEGRFKSEKWENQVPVEMTTFDALIEEFGEPRYAKIDVEGFEKNVIAGLTRKIGSLSFEFSSEFIDEADEICLILTKTGFRHFNISLGEHDNFVFDGRWVDPGHVISSLKTMIERDPLLWGDIYAA